MIEAFQPCWGQGGLEEGLGNRAACPTLPSLFRPDSNARPGGKRPSAALSSPLSPNER